MVSPTAITSSTKGQEASHLKVIIVLAILLIVLLVFTYSAFSDFENTSWASTCKSSIAAHSKFSSDIICPTQEITIKTKDQAQAKEDFANAMKTCWDIYGEGKINLFDAQSANFCEICYIVDLDGPDLENMYSYLYTHRTKVDNKAVFYSDYFAGAPTSIPVQDATLESSKKQAIIFKYVKDSKEFQQELLKLGGSAGTGAAGAGAFTIASALLISTPPGWVIAAVGAGVSTITYAILDTGIGTKFVEDQVDIESFPSLIITPYEQGALEQMGCEVITAQQDLN